MDQDFQQFAVCPGEIQTAKSAPLNETSGAGNPHRMASRKQRDANPYRMAQHQKQEEKWHWPFCEGWRPVNNGTPTLTDWDNTSNSGKNGTTPETGRKMALAIL